MGNIHAMNVCEESTAEKNAGTPPTRLLPKMSDPRSPTEGIVRTPIEVMCTPKERTEIQGTILKFDTPVKNIDASISEEAMETSLTESEKNDAISETRIKPYLETDIDAVDEAFGFTSSALQHPRVKELRINNLPEMKSPSDILQMDSLSSRIDSVSFNDISIDDPSVIVSDCEELFEKDSKPVYDWLLTLEGDRLSFGSIEDAIQKEAEKALEQATAVEEIQGSDTKEDTFYTPERKKSLLKENVRRPLSCLTQNKISEPVKSGIKATKVWRGIHEERERRGLSLGEENTPPLLPPVDKVSSAPGKLVRRRHIVDWDQDTTMFI